MEDNYYSLGFKSNPFEFTIAELENGLKDYFVEPSYFHSIKGDYDNPASCIVFGRRGGGKSTQRRMLEEWAIDKPILVVVYDTFDFDNEESFEKVDLNYHLKNIIRETLLQLIIKVSEGESTVNKLSKEDKKILFALCQNYLGDVTGKEVRETVRKIKSTPQKVKDFWENNIGIFEPLLNFILSLFKVPTIDLPNDLIDSNKLIVSLRRQLALVFKFANQVGLKSIYILIDKVDENHFTLKNHKKTFELIKPLLIDLKTLEESEGYAFKFFLWDEIYWYYKKYGRPDRIKDYHIEWSTEELEEILKKRLEFFSEGKITSFSDFTEKHKTFSHVYLNKFIDNIIVSLSWKSPRDMIRFCGRIMDEFLKTRENEKVNIIDIESIDSASKKFCTEIIEENYHDINTTLKKMKQAQESIWVFNPIENRLEGNKILLTIAELAKLKEKGCIKNISLIEGKEIFNIQDPRLLRVVFLNMKIDEFYQRQVKYCKNCGEITLLGIGDYHQHHNEIECWNCNYRFEFEPFQNRISEIDISRSNIWTALRTTFEDGDIVTVLKRLKNLTLGNNVLQMEVLKLLNEFYLLEVGISKKEMSPDDYFDSRMKILNKTLKIINVLDEEDFNTDSPNEAYIS